MTFPILSASFISVLLSLSIASAQCSFSTAVFEGNLEAAATENGFVTLLVTPEDELSEIGLECEEGTLANLTITPPSRLKDGGPKLEGPFRSYFIYNGKRYTHQETVTISGGFKNRVVRIGMSVEDKGHVLLVGEYRYQLMLIITNKSESPDDDVVRNNPHSSSGN